MDSNHTCDIYMVMATQSTRINVVRGRVDGGQVGRVCSRTRHVAAHLFRDVVRGRCLLRRRY